VAIVANATRGWVGCFFRWEMYIRQTVKCVEGDWDGVMGCIKNRCSTSVIISMIVAFPFKKHINIYTLYSMFLNFIKYYYII
jgi:hypothetical protein